jgi:hypothetical protein
VSLNENIENTWNHNLNLPPFPNKQLKFWTDHLNEKHIEARRALLENYLKKLSTNSKLRSSDAFLTFLSPDSNDALEQTWMKKESLFEPRSNESIDQPSESSPGNSNEYISEEITGVSIVAAQILKHDHVVYQVNVENVRKTSTYQKWTGRQTTPQTH